MKFTNILNILADESGYGIVCGIVDVVHIPESSAFKTVFGKPG